MEKIVCKKMKMEKKNVCGDRYVKKKCLQKIISHPTLKKNNGPALKRQHFSETHCVI